MKTSEHSSEIKSEILQIIEAFGLGEFECLLSFEPSAKVDGYIYTQFQTSIGTYDHWYMVK